MISLQFAAFAKPFFQSVLPCDSPYSNARRTMMLHARLDSNQRRQGSTFSRLEREDFFPFGFHVRHRPAASHRFVPGLVQPADKGLTIVSPLALGVGVMHQAHEARAAAAAVHSSICWSPSEFPNAKIAAWMKRLMPTGLPGPSSTNSILESFTSTGLPLRQLKTHYAGGAHHLLGRNAVNTFGEDAHELDAATGNDKGLETVGAEIAQQLQHRLVNQFGIGPIEPGWRAVAIQSATNFEKASWSCRYGLPP